MTVPGPEDIARDLPAELGDAERRELAETGVRLQAERPLPDPNFRGELRRRLLKQPAGALSLSPGRVKLLSASYGCFGVALLGIAAAGVAGAGPFAA